MKIQSKWALTLAFAAVLAFGVAACGGSGSGGSSGSSASAHISGTLTIWDTEYKVLPKYTKAVNQLDADFEKAHPGLKVTRVAEPPSYEALYRAAFTAHEGPDIMNFPAAPLSFRKGLEELNHRISPEMQEQLGQWEIATAGYTAEGAHYAVPLGINGWVFYYNKGLFKKAGLPTKFEPKSWAEVRAAAEKLKAAGIAPFTGGNKEGYQNSFWFGIGFEGNGATRTHELASGKMRYTDKAVANAFEPLTEMNKAGLFISSYFSTPSTPEGYASFGEGKGAMILGFWNALGYWGEYDQTLGEKNVGIFLPPGNKGPIGTIASVYYGIPVFAKNKAAAWAYIEYIASKKGIEFLDNVGGFMPNRKDVSVPASAPIQERELLDAARARGTMVAPFAVIPSNIAYGVMPREINQYLQGRTSLVAAQKAIQEAAEKVE